MALTGNLVHVAFGHAKQQELAVQGLSKEIPIKKTPISLLRGSASRIGMKQLERLFLDKSHIGDPISISQV